MILKGNESQQEALRVLESAAKHVDAIYATYTWEKGPATRIFEQFGANLSFFEWNKRFDDARNYAMSQIPDEYEYMLWLDMDDVLIGGENIRDLVKAGADAFFATYNYQIDPATGEVVQKHPRERIVRKNSFEWKGRLHETLIPKNKVKNVFTEAIEVNHFPGKDAFEEGLRRNIDILEKAYDEEGETHDPRTEYYLARCYFDAGKYEKSKKLLTDYLKHSGWDEERAMARHYLADIIRGQGDVDGALSQLFEAIRERPEFPTWYISLAITYAQKEDWDRALFYVKTALSMDEPKTAMVLTPRDDKARALEVLYSCLLAKNNVRAAVAAAEQLLAIFPGKKEYRERVEYAAYLAKNVGIGKSILELVRRLEISNPDKIEGLLNMLPEDMQSTALCEKLRHKHAPSRVHTNEIAYFCGKGFEKWDEKSIEKGIGGSETAVIQLAKEWAKQGKRVVVYGDPVEEHESDGVQWKPYWKFSVRDRFDTLIIWRNESLLDAPLKANRIFFDAHDVLSPSEWKKSRVAKVDNIFVKSKFHRSFIPDVPDEKIVIIPNGIDLSMIPEKIEKRSNTIIYSSSYDRGLEYGLKYGWPIIKKEIPDAELHIYYGWDLFDRFYSGNPERMKWKKKMKELMAQPGITEHGRVSQRGLMKAKSEAVVHWYPCTFEEIDCISVRESATAGCTPIMTDYAALAEKPYGVKVSGDPYAKKTHEELAERVVSVLKGTIPLADDTEAARKENWPAIAQLWSKYFV